MKKIESLLCVIMLLTGPINAEIVASSDVSGKKMLAENSEISRLKRMFAWVEQNRVCLTGCSEWASFAANYTLGAVIQLGQSLILSSAHSAFNIALKKMISPERKVMPILLKLNDAYREAAWKVVRNPNPDEIDRSIGDITVAIALATDDLHKAQITSGELLS